jgi:hypothetical protein
VSATIVIQCAAKKIGAYLRTSSGQRVGFLARPQRAARRPGWLFVRPDDPADGSRTWRQVLSDYNRQFAVSGDNPDRLSVACELYANRAYRDLAQAVGAGNLYILSAGWGLVRATYLLPNYDITFNNQASVAAIRRKDDQFCDEVQMAADVTGSVHFLGGLGYIPLFCGLTGHVRTERIVHHNSKNLPDAPGCRLVRYQTTTRTNWHYECARALTSSSAHSLRG